MEKELDIWLTTDDNPWNPFTQFESWKDFDERIKGYYTCQRVARRARNSECLTDYENDLATNRAIESIVDEDSVYDPVKNVMRNYRLVTPNDCVDF